MSPLVTTEPLVVILFSPPSFLAVTLVSSKYWLLFSLSFSLTAHFLLFLCWMNSFLAVGEASG